MGSDALLADMLEHAADAVVMIDKENRVAFFNAAAERMWGWRRDEVLKRDIAMLIPRAPHGEIDFTAGRSGEFLISRKDGTTALGILFLARIGSTSRTTGPARADNTPSAQPNLDIPRLHALGLDHLPQAVFIADADGHIVYANASFTHLFGYSADEIHGHSPGDLLAGPHTDTQALEIIRAGLSTPWGLHADVLLYDKHGESHWMDIVVSPLVDHAGQREYVVSTLIDVTLNRMPKALQRLTFEALAHDTPLAGVMDVLCRQTERIAPDLAVAIFAATDDSRDLRCLAAPSLAGLSLPTIALPTEETDSLDFTHAPLRRATPHSAALRPSDGWAPYMQALSHAGYSACWTASIRGNDHRPLGLLAFHCHNDQQPTPLHRQLAETCLSLCATAFERENAKAHIHRLAFYDPLTGLPNRRLFAIQVERALAHAARNATALSMLFIDLDRFKQVNDTFGHPAGDALLREIARRLSVEARAEDISGRLSGDEFALLLPQANAQQAETAAERLLHALCRPFVFEGATLAPSASIGISLFPDDGHDLDTLLHCADLAMYRAKRNGRQRVFRFQADMTHATRHDD